MACRIFAGALLVVTCAYYPLVYLPVAATLRGLDPALEETAHSLRTRVIAVGRRPPRALHRMSDRRNESARPRPLRARRRGNAAQLSIGSAGLETMAGADRIRRADPRDPGDAVGYGRLLADPTRLGGDFALSAVAAAAIRRDTGFGRVWPGRSSRGPTACGASGLPHNSLSESLDD